MRSDAARPGWSLSSDAFGRLILERTDLPDTPVTPVCGFPITTPDAGIALMNAQGQELAWIERLDTLPANLRRLIDQELAQREFKPEILRIRHASTWATPSRWDVDTDRGPTQLTLKAEEDIRRLAAGALLIVDAHGVQFLVRDMATLDKTSRRILDHFL
ncbi:MAG: DUF1854 domain-containing protein [Castellaniella sp.]|uniref:cyanophycin metabolism-associated DUF1854 family protein n=1 Tax=Castellaniella sp. TaxID=1955812 RepID=UPI002A35C315|nr:DUF1854 domain-containing protein [Castellaniella sp.]MDY0308901.1 DUF1854 domain-containing protein [Castellaniella sp.]